MPRTSPYELTISVTTSPQPPLRFTRRLKALSVMPAMGASANGGTISTEPIFMLVGLPYGLPLGAACIDAICRS